MTHRAYADRLKLIGDGLTTHGLIFHIDGYEAITENNWRLSVIFPTWNEVQYVAENNEPSSPERGWDMIHSRITAFGSPDSLVHICHAVIDIELLREKKCKICAFHKPTKPENIKMESRRSEAAIRMLRKEQRWR